MDFGPHYLETSLDFPPSARFGMGVHVGELVDHLVRLGRRVTVVTGPGSGDDDRPGLTVVRHEPLNHLSLADPLLVELAAAAELWPAVQQLGDVPDVVHNHGWATVPLACLAAEKHGVPLVSSVHVVDAAFDAAQGPARPASHSRHLMKSLEEYGLRNSDLVVVPNAHIAQLLADSYAIDESRIAVLPLGTPGPIPVKRSYEAQQPFQLLSVGRLISYKGTPALLQAMERLSTTDIQLDLIGDGPLLRDIGDRTNVRVHGSLEHGDVLKRYQLADVVVLPSVLETHSLVLHEAMKAGAPIIAADVEPMSSLLANGSEAILVSVENSEGALSVRPDALADAILELAGNPVLRRTLGVNARARAALVPTPAEYARRFDELCRQRFGG